MNPNPTSPGTLRFYLSIPHPCGYLPDREATEIWVDPDAPMDTRLYTQLSELGFRRSGDHVYRPRCQACSACIPVRLDVTRFTPNRAQRRCWATNQDLECSIREVAAADYAPLYARYIRARHAGGVMDTAEERDPDAFLGSRWCDTRFHEWRLNGELIAVATVDHLENGLSAVYTFFDPAHARRSLGVFAVLHQIEYARQRGLRWLYLGYWIEDCSKMSYKQHYQPLEYFSAGSWHPKSVDAKHLRPG